MIRRSERVEKILAGVRDALPTALGYISIGLACGVVASPIFFLLEMALMSVLGLCWGGPVCDDLSDCGSFFNIEYGFDGVFDQSP